MTISNNVEAKRFEPAPVQPVEQNGIRYTAPPFAFLSKGMEHNGGYVEAIDIKTNKKLWLKEVYRPKYDPSLEGDVQDVFITSLSIENNKLIIINEAGDKFLIDITDAEEINKQKYIYTIFLAFVGITVLIVAFYLFLAKIKKLIN